MVIIDGGHIKEIVRTQYIKQNKFRRLSMNILQRLFGIKKSNKDKYDGFDIEELPHAGRYFPRYKGRYMFFWFTNQCYELQSNISGSVYHNTKEEAKRTIDKYIELRGVGTNIISVE
jgi:hypothetical protein